MNNTERDICQHPSQFSLSKLPERASFEKLDGMQEAELRTLRRFYDWLSSAADTDREKFASMILM